MKFKSKHAGEIVVIKPSKNMLVDGKIIKQSGKRVEFDDEGYLDTEDEDVIEGLKNNKFYGSAFSEVSEQEKKAKKRLNKVEEMLNKVDEEEEEVQSDDDEVMPYREFQKQWYASHDGGIEEFTKAWNKYKEENGI